MNSSKICSRCSQEKPSSEFRPRPKNRDGLDGICKGCHSNRNKDWAKNNPDKYLEIQQRKNRKRKYGVSGPRFQELIEQCNNSCSICLTPFNTTPHIDHDHCTGEVRGLLCGSCNRALGLLKDSPEVIFSAYTYLKGKPNAHAESNSHQSL